MNNSKSGSAFAAVLVCVLIAALLAIAGFAIFSFLDDVDLTPSSGKEENQSLVNIIADTGPQALLGSGTEPTVEPADEPESEPAAEPEAEPAAEPEAEPADAPASDSSAQTQPPAPSGPPGDMSGEFWEYDSKTQTITFHDVFELDNYGPEHYLNAGHREPWAACWPYVRHMVIGPNVLEIGYEAFRGCPRLETVEIKDGVTSIGSMAFAECPELREVVMGDTVSKLYVNVFYECPKLEKVKLSMGIREMEVNMFYNCVSLEEITLPAALKVLPACAFSCCSGLRSVTLPEGLEVIDFSAFYDCVSLESITLPEGLKRINDAAFAFTGLKEIYLPGSLEYLAPDTFVGCPYLTEVRFGGSYEQWLDLRQGLRIDEEVKVICLG